MSRWGVVVRAVAWTVVGAGLAGCSSNATSLGDTATSSESATPTTRAPRIVDDSGRPPVTFDPCLDLPDEIMTEAGYDAAHKEFADMPMGWYTFLGCAYRKSDPIPGVRRGYSLNVMAGNVSLDEEREKNGHVATETSINGRPALREVGPTGNDECTYVLQTDFGIVLFNRLYHKDRPGPVPQEEWCAGLEEFVRSVEPYIEN